MSYALIALAFFATLVGIRGETWDKQRPGVKKLTGMGWAAFAIAICAATFTTIKEVNEQREIQQLQRKAEFKRLDGLDQLAHQSWYVKVMTRDIAYELDKRPELLELAKNQLALTEGLMTQTLQTYSNSLERDELIAAESLRQSISFALSGLTTSKKITDTNDLKEIAIQAHRANLLFCEPIQHAEPFCEFSKKFKPRR